MKKVICLILVICAVCSIFTVTYGEGGYLWMVDAGSGVNVRNKTKGGEVVGFLRHGEIIRVVEENNLWVGFYMEDGSIGYVYKEYLHIAHAEEIEEWERKKKLGIKIENEDAYLIGEIKEDTNVYKTANGKILGKLEAGEKVYIRQTGKFWYRIVWQNKEIGYVQTAKIKVLEPNIPGNEEVRIVVANDGSENVPIWEDSSKTTKIAKIKVGHFVRILEEDEKGYVVAYDAYGNTGYISKMWLKQTKFFD